ARATKDAKKAAKPVAKSAAVGKKDGQAPAPRKKDAAAKAAVEETSKAAPAKAAPAPKRKQKEEAAKPAVAVRSPFAPRPVGKVAVAVVSRAPTPAPKTKYKVVPYKTDEATG